MPIRIVVIVLLVAACGRDAPVATGEGDLLAVEQPGPWVTIRHDEVPGLLPAKTTRLLARSPDVGQGFAAGTRVRFAVTQDGNRLVVTHLERLGTAKGPDRTELADQTAHHGGVVATAGELHVEAAASRDGTIRIWLDDEDREPVSLAGASGQVELDLPDGRVTRPLAVRDDALVPAPTSRAPGPGGRRPGAGGSTRTTTGCRA